ncbi:hypothetical protein [Lichenifustis flavocetrariae]|uniref:Secreted protein n=1 Tax=Lichenifustis flavocetrariae TaxID=2949735 RepID=A0AA41Z2P0_9HYPH|nr:hypothetical protein [Lichenifustis flavocetrariae]MCW6513116.1 hypothetical protein [Lichenifustis flavocetrariae]
MSLVLALSTLALGGATSLARADCESDMIKLEAALKSPTLTPAGKVALQDASVKSVAAMKKDDDATCHKVIAEALPKAGMTLK